MIEEIINVGKKIVTGVAMVGITACSAANYNAQPNVEAKWFPGMFRTETGYEVVGCSSKGFDKGFAMTIAADNARNRIRELFGEESINLSAYASQYQFSDNEICYKIIIPEEKEK